MLLSLLAVVLLAAPAPAEAAPAEAQVTPADTVAADVAATDKIRSVGHGVKLRKLHLVRPDLIPYPTVVESYC